MKQRFKKEKTFRLRLLGKLYKFLRIFERVHFNAINM